MQIADVRQLTPGVLGVSGVPTLILTDGTGTVRDFWLGRLGPNVEALVMSRLRGETNNDGVSIDVAALREALGKKEHIVVLSIDDRDVYKREHIYVFGEFCLQIGHTFLG